MILSPVPGPPARYHLMGRAGLGLQRSPLGQTATRGADGCNGQMQGAAEHRRRSTLAASEAGEGVGGPPGEATFKVQLEHEPSLSRGTDGRGRRGPLNRGSDLRVHSGKTCYRAKTRPTFLEPRWLERGQKCPSEAAFPGCSGEGGRPRGLRVTVCEGQ